MKNLKIITSPKKSQFAILTVVSMRKNSFGLQDHNFPFQADGLSIVFLDDSISLVNSLMAYNNHGRLTNPLINTWIQDNNLHTTNEPLKLVFKIKRKGRKYQYILYRTQGNYLVNCLSS